MPIYRITAPNGVTYQTEGPPNATPEQVKAVILAAHPEAAKSEVPGRSPAAPARPAQGTAETAPLKGVEPAGIFEYFTNREEAIRKDREYRAYLQDKMQRSELEDIKTQTGFFDRLGDLFSRGLLSARSGIKDVEAAIETDPTLKKQFTQEARRFAADTGVEIKGATTEQDVKDNFLRNAVPYIIEKGAESLPQMIASTNPLGVLGAALPSNIGSQAREAAQLQGREDVTLGDVAKVAPGAVAVTALDTLGLGGILAAPAKTALGRVGKAALLEGTTEAIQSAIEYANPRVVTGSDVDAGELFEQAAFGALAGAGIGGGLRGTGELISAPFRKEAESAVEPDAEESPEVEQEYLRLVSEATAARMQAESGLTQRQAFDQVLRDAGKLYQTAITNVAGERAADVDTELDVSEGAGAGVPPAGEPGVAPDATGAPAGPAAGGVGEPDLGVPPADTGEAPGVPALDLGDFAPAVATVQEAPNNKARKPLAMQLVSDVVQANPDLQGLSSNKYNQAANQIVQAAARGEQFDPVAIVQGVAPKPKVEAAPEVETTPAVELTPETYVDRYLAGEGRGNTESDLELQQYAANFPTEIEAEFAKRAAPTTAPAPTPQQVVDNITAFAGDEARTQGFDPGMFREGARDAVRGVEPLEDALILEAQGQEALDAYKAGIQYGQERQAEAQAAPEQVFEDIGEPSDNVASLSKRRADKVLPKIQAVLSGEVRMHPDDIGDLADDLDDLRKAGAVDDATFDELEEKLFAAERVARDRMTPPNDNRPETPLEKAQREYEAATENYSSFFYNLDDERAYADRRTRARKEYERELDDLEVELGAKRAAYDAAWEAERGGTFKDLTSEPRATDIAARAGVLPEPKRVIVRARLDRIMAQHAKDGDTGRLVRALEGLRQDVDNRIDRDREKRSRGRVRGFERAMEVIYRAERNEQLSPESAELVRWLLQQNPAIADELALSIREGGNQTAAGQYSPAARLATIFATRANDGTATHEILHHAERLMPENVRAGIRAAWMKRVQDLIKVAEQTDNTDMREVLGTIVRAYYGDTEAQKALQEAFEAGTIPYSAYHLSNPSEFWAVNAADLVGRRAKQTGWLKDARNWIRGLIEKAKDLLGLPNESAIITGLKAILAVESGTISGTMLSDKSDVFRVYGGEGATNPNRSKLAEAQALEAAEGAISGPTGNIRTKTGWFRGVDGMWRFEIDDRDMRFQPGYEPIRLVKGRTYLLGQIIAHPELFRQYPPLQQVNVVVKDTEGGGHWDWTKNEIAISGKTPTIESYYLNTLVHEIQHAVQRWENFAGGASTRSYPVSSAAVRKALSFLDKFKDSSLFLWDKTYKRADLKAMRNDLEVLRDTFGSSLEKAYADWEAYENSVYKLNDERQQRRREAVDMWWAGDHPEAVKHRELQARRITLGKQLNDYTVQRTPEERAAIKQQFDEAAEASMAQYKYAAGLANMLAQPDISDLEARFKELADTAKDVGRRLDQARDIAELHGANKLMYYLTAGEVEARDVERRRMMSPFQREGEAPYVGEPFGELSDMILVDQYSGRSSTPPKVTSNGKEVKLTEAQTRTALEKAAAIRRKMNRIQQRIANTNRTADILSGQIELGKLARGDKENWALLRGAIDTLSVGKWRAILPALSTEDIFRILKGRLPGLAEADRIIRQDMTRYETKEYLNLADELEQIAEFLKAYPKATQALSDLQFASVAYQVDPSKAFTAEEYADKFDKKTRDLRTELGNTSVVDAKRQRKLKTKIDNRLKEIKSVYEGVVAEDGRVFGWRDLARPELGANKGKEIFKLIRDAHRKDLEAGYQAIRSRLEETKEGEKLDEALEKLDKQFKPARDQVIYFPAMRFGSYYARVGTGANSIFKMFETETKRNQFMRLMKAQGEEVTEFGNVDDLRNDFQKMAGGPLKEVLDLFEDNPKDIGALRSQVFDLWLQTMSSGDMRKHMAPRKMRAGYSTDILKNFANFRRSSINSAKRAQFGYKLRNEISRAKDTLEGQPNKAKAKMQEFIKEMELRVLSDITPPQRDNSVWQQAIQLGNKLAFYQYLANPKTAFIQLTQMHIVALPMLSQKYGTAKAAAALGKYGFSSLGGFVVSPLKAIKRKNGSFTFSWEQPDLLDNPISTLKRESDPELYEVLSEGWQDGRDLNLWMDTFANDIGGYGNADPNQRNALQELAAGRPVTAALRGATFVFEAMGTLMHQMERVNREATFMAALELDYRNARKVGKSHAEAKKAAIENATATTLAATFDFSAYNKPRVITAAGPAGGIGRISGQFYTYPYMMTSLLMRNMYTAIKTSGLEAGERSAAIKVATGTLLNIGLYAGLTGLPLYGIFKVAGYLMSALFGEDDETDWDWWFRNEWIPEFFGPDGTVANLFGLDDDTAATLALAAEKGPISAITDIDLSNSVALDFMFFLPQESRAETPEGKFVETTFNVLTGAFGGAVLDYIKAGRDVATGYTDRALEKLPKVVSNIAKANRFGAEGQLNYAGELAGMDKDFWTSDKQILLALGFNSTEAAQRQQQNYEGKKITTKIEKARTDVLSQYRKLAIDVEKAGGMTEELQSELEDAQEAVNEFNEAHPEYVIGFDTLYETQMNAITEMRESQLYAGVPVDKRGRTPHLEGILQRRQEQSVE